jgi:hypothetical protein
VHRLGDLGGDVVLDVEDFTVFGVVILRPQRRVAVDADEARGDAHAGIDFPRRSVDEIGGVHRLADGADVARFALELENRGARDHAEPRHAGQRHGDFIGESIREIILRGIT